MLLFFFILSVNSPLLVRDVSSSPKEPTIQTRVKKAKLQAIFQIQQEITMQSLLWYRPVGLTIIMTHQRNSPFVIRSVRLEGLGSEERVYHYSDKEAKILEGGGVSRIFASDKIEKDLVIKPTVAVLNSDQELQHYSTSVSIKRSNLPSVVEIMLVETEEEGLSVTVKRMGKADSSKLEDLYSRHIKVLIDNKAFLEAAVHLSKAMDFPAKNASAQERFRLQLGEVYFEWELDNEASFIFQRLSMESKSGTRSSTALFYLGKIEYRKGNYEEALELFLKARRGLPLALLAESLYLSGNSQLYMKSYDSAAKTMNRVPKGSTLYPFALYSRGVAFINAGNVKSARAQFEKILELDPGEDDLSKPLIDRAHITYGFYLVDQEIPNRALEVFGAIPPGSLYDDQVRFGIGWAYLKKGQCDKAVVTFNSLVSKWPNSIYSEEARLKMGACYSKLGAYRDAVENYQEALRVYSIREDSLKNLQQYLIDLPLEEWLATQRSEFFDPIKKNPLIRELASDSSIQKTIEGYDSLIYLIDQVDRLSKTLKDESQITSLIRQIEKLKDQVENEAKEALSRRILEIQGGIYERVIQADIGLLKNFNLQ